jgi:hypothetical protein
MPDLDAVICSNGWVYVFWDLVPGATHYHLTRAPSGGGASTNLVNKTAAQVNASHRTLPALVAPGTPGATNTPDFRLGRFVPATFTAGAKHSFRFLHTAAGQAAEVPQAAVRVDPSFAGVVLGWKPAPAAHPRNGRLWLEQRTQADGVADGWRAIANFAESDADNVHLPLARWGFFLDHNAIPGGAGAVDLTFRLEVQAPSGNVTHEATLNEAEAAYPSRLAFFHIRDELGTAVPEDWLVRDGANVVPYFDHYAPIDAHNFVCVATHWEPDPAPAQRRSHWYLTRAADAGAGSMVRRISDGAEEDGGLLHVAAQSFGPHVAPSTAVPLLTTLIAPVNDAVGISFPLRDGWPTVAKHPPYTGNMRAVLFIPPYPGGGAGTAADARVVHRGCFIHEYQHLCRHKAYADAHPAPTPLNSAWLTQWVKDRNLDEGAGMYAEDVVGSLSPIHRREGLAVVRRWPDHFLFFGWPSDASLDLYGYFCAWVAYNANRMESRAVVNGYTPANLPRPETAGFGPFFREFQLVMALNRFASAGADLALTGWTGPGPRATADQLTVSLRRTDATDHADVLHAPELQGWSVAPERWGDGSGSNGTMFLQTLSAASELQGRAAGFFTHTANPKRASAWVGQFQRPADAPHAARGTLHLEFRVPSGNADQVRQVLAAARRGDHFELYQATTPSGGGAHNLLLAVPDYGTEVDCVVAVVASEKSVSPLAATLAAVPTANVPWNVYVTARPEATVAGFEHAQAWRGGDNLVLVGDGQRPVSYVGPGQVRAWVLFNQSMQDGASFHARLGGGAETALPRDAFQRGVFGADVWRGQAVQLAAAGAREGETATLEIGRAARVGPAVTGGVRSFAGVLMDRAASHAPGGTPESDSRHRFVIDTTGPTLDTMTFVNGNHGDAEASLADGVSLVGVVRIDVTASDPTSGVAAIEVFAESTTGHHVFSAGRAVCAPNAADGEYARTATATFFWSTDAAPNAPVNLHVTAYDRVGNATRRTFSSTLIANPRPGVAANTGNLRPPRAAAPTLDPLGSHEMDKLANGSWTTLADGDPARGKLRFDWSGAAHTSSARLVVTAQTPTSGTAWNEVFSKWYEDAAAVHDTFETDSRAFPDGRVTLRFVLRDEGDHPSSPVTFSFIAANRPPRVIPLAPMLTTRGAVDVWAYVDDRAGAAVSPGTCKVEWKLQGAARAAFERELAALPDGARLRRATLRPYEGFTQANPVKPGELVLHAGPSGARGASFPHVPLLPLHALGAYHTLPARVVRLTVGSTAEPTFFYEITCAAELSVLVDARDTGGAPQSVVRLRVQSEAPVQAPAGLRLTFTPEPGCGAATIGDAAADGAHAGEFTVPISIAGNDHHQTRGLLAIHVEDALGNATDLELPLWLVKDPLVRPAQLRWRHERQELAADGTITRSQHWTAGGGSTPAWIPALGTIELELGELGHHLFLPNTAAQSDVNWKPQGAAEVLGGLAGLAPAFTDTWEAQTMLNTAPDGDGAFVLHLADHYGNLTNQSIAGFRLAATSPAVNIATGQSTASSAVQVQLAPAPSVANASGLTRAVLTLRDVDDPDPRAPSVAADGTTSPVSFPFTIRAGTYTAVITAQDGAGQTNQASATVTITP